MWTVGHHGGGWCLYHTTDGVTNLAAGFGANDAGKQLAIRCRDLLTTFGLVPLPLPEGIDQ